MAEGIVSIGENGLVASGLVDWQSRLGEEGIIPVSSRSLNITDESKLLTGLSKFQSDKGCSHVLVLGAYTNVDGAETPAGKLQALQVNWQGVSKVVSVADRLGLRVIHVSTDMVFPNNPNKPGPYEEDVVVPQSLNIGNRGVYGTTKAWAEDIVSNSEGWHSIVRISYPFGNANGSGDFINKTLHLVRKGIPLFADQFITPTYIPSLHQAVIHIVRESESGVFNVVCSGVTTPYEFGRYVAEKAGIDPDSVLPGSIHEFRKQFPNKAPRTVNGGLLETKMQISPSWQEGVNWHFASNPQLVQFN